MARDCAGLAHADARGLDGDSTDSEATRLLEQLRAGDERAEGRLYELLQSELRALALAQLNGGAQAHTLQPTALVNEAWLRLARAGGAPPQDRAHFMAVAARAMRTALVDHARRKRAAKRGGDERRVPLEHALDRTLDLCVERGIDPLDLDDALARMAREEPRQAKLVELRFFGGLTREEAGEILGLSRATLARDWELARHWLIWELGLADE
jgi:RNA polymerase sigma factor (TIGR02999 family)